MCSVTTPDRKVSSCTLAECFGHPLAVTVVWCDAGTYHRTFTDTGIRDGGRSVVLVFLVSYAPTETNGKYDDADGNGIEESPFCWREYGSG
jgi:hypothetical protein